MCESIVPFGDICGLEVNLGLHRIGILNCPLLGWGEIPDCSNKFCYRLEVCGDNLMSCICGGCLFGNM